MQATPDPVWQILSWKAAVGAALIAALAALVKGFWALWQQRKELRWKQAELARELLDKWFSWEGSNNALRMVDEGAGNYALSGYGNHHIDPEHDIPRALAVVGTKDRWVSSSNTDADRLVRKCFDVLLYCFERVEHSVQIGVATRSDFVVPAEYYVKQLARFYAPVAEYIDCVGFSRAKQFLRSFGAWEEAAKFHEQLEGLRAQLDGAFAPDTAYPRMADSGPSSAASAGHCAVVAAIVQTKLGGQMLSTFVDGEEHWFNRLPVGGALVDVDITGDQFGAPKIQVAQAGRLYSNAVERPFEDLQAETLDRAIRLAGRAGFWPTAERIKRQKKRT